jgi:GTP diphosphokinase / guanosine-3',5'-bis(diphosphate) 3'-diphosphatase
VNRVWRDVSEKLSLAGIQVKFIEMPLEANLMQKLQSTDIDTLDAAQGRGTFGAELDLLFSSIEDCYRALGVIFNTWPSVSSEFRDWTAIPLPNGQQGIRCLVGVRSDDFVTFRLKTEEMHRQSEWGPLFHIRNARDYGEAIGLCPQAETLSRIAELDRSTGSTHLFLELLEQDLLQPKMRVFLANNGYFHLPMGATVLDVAFYVGLDTGCACRGAIVNERAVDVSFVLRDGDLIRLELTDAKAPEPSWIYGKTYRTAKTRYAILNR